MKKSYPLSLLVLSVTLLSCSISFAQQTTAPDCFIAATNTESIAASAGGVSNTGNDIKPFNSVYVQVHVWDGGGIAWDYDDGLYTGSIPATDYYDPDVTLVVDNASTTPILYAVVAYFSGTNSDVEYDIYEWDNISAFVLISPGNVLASAYPTSINIDGDIYGQFAIIWDDPSLISNNLQIVGGVTNLGAPVLSTNGILSIGNSTEMIFPDVALFNNDNGDVVVNFSYMDITQVTTYVGNADFKVDLTGVSGAISNSSPWSNTLTSGDYGHNPRLASPQTCVDPVGLYNLWTVVCTRQQNSLFDIVGYTLWNNTVYTNVYTDGSFDLCTINETGNKYPAVSYTYMPDSRGLTVGWLCDYDVLDNGFEPRGVVAIHCLEDGSYFGPNPSGPPQFMTVFTDNMATTDADYWLSISGRDCAASEMVYTFFSETLFDVLYKKVYFYDDNLRLDEGVSSNGVYPNPFHNNLELKLRQERKDTDYELTLSDIAGKMLLKATGKQEQLNSALHSISTTLKPGVYLLNITDEHSVVIENTKLVKAD